MQIGYGSYERDSAERVSVRQTRLRFLAFVRLYAPTVMDDLQVLFSIYENFAAAYLLELKNKGQLRAESPLNQAPDWEDIQNAEGATLLRDSVFEWSNEHNLNADWCRQWAVRAFKAWLQDEEARTLRWWTTHPRLVRPILFPALREKLGLDYNKFIELSFLSYQLGVIDFSFDDEPYHSIIGFDADHNPEFFDDSSWDGVSPRQTGIGLTPDEQYKYKEKLPPLPPSPPSPYCDPDWFDSMGNSYWKGGKGLPHWGVTTETREHYLDRITKEAWRQLNAAPLFFAVDSSHRKALVDAVIARAQAYCDSVEAFYRSRKHWRKISARPALADHLMWTVYIRVLKRTWDEIAIAATERRAKTISYHREAIKKAVKDTLMLIGLPLEPTFHTKKGRPRKSDTV